MSEMDNDFRLRPGDQPLPHAGKVAVGQEVMQDVLRWPGVSLTLKQAVVHDLAARIELGKQRYGRPLETFNGRRASLDAWQELEDAALYLKQLELESGVCRDLYETVLNASFRLREFMMTERHDATSA